MGWWKQPENLSQQTKTLDRTQTQSQMGETLHYHRVPTVIVVRWRPFQMKVENNEKDFVDYSCSIEQCHVQLLVDTLLDMQVKFEDPTEMC